MDADALGRLLLSLTADPARPLDRLARGLHRIAGDRATATGAGTGGTGGTPVSRLELSLDDWQYQAWVEHGDVAAVAVHTVRSVVLKHQPLPFDEWVMCVAGHLAEYAATHRHVYDAIIGLDRG